MAELCYLTRKMNRKPIGQPRLDEQLILSLRNSYCSAIGKRRIHLSGRRPGSIHGVLLAGPSMAHCRTAELTLPRSC
jgi:hypothetical protein